MGVLRAPGKEITKYSSLASVSICTLVLGLYETSLNSNAGIHYVLLLTWK